MLKNKTAKKILVQAVSPIVAVAVVFLIWQIASSAVGSQLILPSPAQAFSDMVFYLSRQAFYLRLAKTILSSILSFLMAVVLAVAVASLAQIHAAVRSFLRMIVRILRSLPTMSVILLMIIWTNSTVTPLLVALLIIFPTLFASIEGAMSGIDRALEETAKIYRIPLYYRIFRIYVPLCAPVFLETAAGALSLTVKLVIAAEVLAHTANSLGELMWQAQVYFETGRLLALTVVAVAVCALLEGGILLVKKFTCSWHEKIG